MTEGWIVLIAGGSLGVFMMCVAYAIDRMQALGGCSHVSSAIIYADDACAIERCPDCGAEVRYGS